MLDCFSLHKLHTTYCMSLYGCEIWNYNSRYISEMFIAWRKMMRKLFKFESYSRRDNLIIYGIPEVKPESIAQCKNSVREFFVNHLNFTDQEATGVDFIRCHRLYTTRKNAVKPVIVRFKNSSDREKVWLRKSAIKDRNLNICEDFPKSIAYNRRKLFPVFSKARKSRVWKKVQCPSKVMCCLFVAKGILSIIWMNWTAS